MSDNPERIGNVVIAYHTQFVTLTDTDNPTNIVCIHVDDILKVSNKLLATRKELLK